MDVHIKRRLVREENGTNALVILNTISYFAPENICVGLLSRFFDDNEKLNEAIELLIKESLIQSNDKRTSIDIFKSVQRLTRKILSAQEREEAVLKRVLELLFLNLSNPSNLNHAISVWRFARRYTDLVSRWCGLPSLVVLGLMEVNRHKEAYLFVDDTLDFLKGAIGENHPETLILQHNMTTLLRAMGKHKESVDILLDIFKKDSKFSHKEDGANYLRELCETSQYKQASYVHQIYFDNKCVSEVTNEMMLTALHDNTLLLHDLGMNFDPLNVMKEDLRNQYEIVYRNVNARCTVKNNIGHVLLKQRRYNAALEVFQKVLSERICLLGEMHSDTLRSRRDIALALQNLGRYHESIEIYTNVAEKFESVLGELHPETLTALSNLASVNNLQQNSRKALELYKDVYQKQQKVLAEKYVETLKVNYKIGQILCKLGENDEALKTLRDVFDGFNDVLGPSHEETIQLKLSLDALETSMAIQTPRSEDEMILSSARKGNLDKLSSLIQNEDDIEYKDSDGKRPLHCAAQYGHVSIVQFLLKRGAMYNVKDKDGNTPLQFAKDPAVRNLLNCVKIFFKDVNTGSQESVSKHILEHPWIVNVMDCRGWSPLHWAVLKRHAKVVCLLLEKGANVTHATSKGNTVLHTVTLKGNKEIAEVLLQSVERTKLCEFINAKTSVGMNTALHVAAENNVFEIVQLLLQNGAIFDVPNTHGKTAQELTKQCNIQNLLNLIDDLFHTAKYGDPAVVRKLQDVAAGERLAILNARNWQKHTLIQTLITNNHKTVARDLAKILKTVS